MEHRDWLLYLGHQNTQTTTTKKKLTTSNVMDASYDLLDVSMEI